MLSYTDQWIEKDLLIYLYNIVPFLNNTENNIRISIKE